MNSFFQVGPDSYEEREKKAKASGRGRSSTQDKSIRSHAEMNFLFFSSGHKKTCFKSISSPPPRLSPPSSIRFLFLFLLQIARIEQKEENARIIERCCCLKGITMFALCPRVRHFLACVRFFVACGRIL